MPEARIIFAQATTYLATAPKSNASYLGIEKALEDVKNGKTLPVPEHLKNIRVSQRAAGTPHADKNDSAYVYRTITTATSRPRSTSRPTQFTTAHQPGL